MVTAIVIVIITIILVGADVIDRMKPAPSAGPVFQGE